MVMCWEGQLDFTMNGRTIRLGPGSIGFAGSNEDHGVRNASTTARARY
jgi:quercetin dioxygenase-like cupin family protein